MTPIQHYYGDRVRALFVLIVLMTFIAIPFWGDLLPTTDTFEIIGGVILIALAGLTNPHTKWVIVIDVLAAAFGAIMLELAAVSQYGAESWILLALREAGTILCLGALYFGVKTLRAMAQEKIGEIPTPWEFGKMPPPKE